MSKEKQAIFNSSYLRNAIDDDEKEEESESYLGQEDEEDDNESEGQEEESENQEEYEDEESESDLDRVESDRSSDEDEDYVSNSEVDGNEDDDDIACDWKEGKRTDKDHCDKVVNLLRQRNKNLDVLKLEECKAYLRKHELMISGTKATCIQRIFEHWRSV